MNGARSKLKNIDWGVIQRVITDPIVFMLHINDIVKLSNLYKLTIYTDDISLTYVTKDVEETIPMLNNGMSKLDVWLRKNHYIFMLKNIPNEFFMSRAVLTPFFSLCFDSQKCIITHT